MRGHTYSDAVVAAVNNNNDMCALSKNEEETTTCCTTSTGCGGASWYRSLKFVECALWIVLLAIIIMLVTADIAVTMLTVHPSACDVKLASLNVTEMCASHCATLFIRG